ncbi:orotate phosphoribosyltransferase [Chryseomicrobium sp. FSL W7-1435]|uniref:orotate phosphoribosyltransferase n=1 Tax=Chryseomicrobium sp. FSL W7-1435 TaxID=2921704 RepID=UPI00315ACD0B
MTTKAAHALLEAQAVQLSTDPLFTWASGIQSPIYCDNRLLMGYPKLRAEVAEELTSLIQTHFSECQVVAGTATAGIPHAAWVSTNLQLPMVYVRSKAKEHGRGNQIEGKLDSGQKVVVVEDLISTGGSSITAVEALKEAGADVLGVISIFSYELPKAQAAFHSLGVPYYSLTNLNELLTEESTLSTEDREFIQSWHAELKRNSLK